MFSYHKLSRKAKNALSYRFIIAHNVLQGAKTCIFFFSLNAFFKETAHDS